MKYVDVTRTISPHMEKYPSDPNIEIYSFKSIDKGNSCNLLKLIMGSHTGTHVDAPRHIFKKGKSVEGIPLDNLICKIFVVDIKKVSIKDFFKNHRSAARGLVLKNDKHGLTTEEAALLLEHNMCLVGTDGMSIEESGDKSHPVHRMLLAKNITIVEGLDLRKAKSGYCRMVCLPLKIKNGDGAPARSILIYD